MSGLKDGLKDNKKILLLSVGLLVATIIGLSFLEGTSTDTNKLINTDTMQFTKPENVLEKGIDYKAMIRTSVGDITIDLFETETPNTVNSFLFLVGQRYYEGVTFHRVIRNFVIQTGDPTGTGSGGPGYTIDDEITSRKYKPYTLGMANAGPNTNGSQFFIISGNIPQANMSNLDGNYTIFGEVVEGFAVVDSIERVTTDSNDKPVNDVTVESIQILEN
ncbi:MAG TPA: peptidylprolyl isomerase [Candidatus Dojkabacteria bacterium]|nr:peptidylprolyl isomerase [Candidatus Dojkabacteria bacterium]HOR06243.1 peptidylprolyl isomerase [Candidatus Dojkabacteria bacterium]HOT61166.1 peptidylprolyl isomerase [Candidatus Dojkabacteria bacterium]HQI92510.1 peptidylprolyl isomerase [Candidatus Dojkabacteria bacterium]